MTFVIATSDAFFERPKNRVRAQRFFLTLIDGDYSFAPVLHVFENLTALTAPDSIFAIHGCRPHAWMRDENAEGRDCVPRSRCDFSGYLRRHFFTKSYRRSIWNVSARHRMSALPPKADIG